MLRNLKNIVLLLILCFIASGIPLYANTIDIRLPSLPVKSPAVGTLAFSAEAIQIDKQQWQVTAALRAEEKMAALQLQEKPFIAMLLLGDEPLTEIDLTEALSPLTDLELLEIQPEAPFQFEFYLNQQALDLPDGSYTLELTFAGANQGEVAYDFSPYLATIVFERPGSYAPALQTIERNQTALLLYFPDEQGNYLIPVTRRIPYTNRPLRSTLDQLVLGSGGALGLPAGSFVPADTGVSLAQGIARLYLPADTGQYNSNATDGAVAVKSYLYSLTSINEVNTVQFYFGNQILQEQFHGVAVDQPLPGLQGGILYGLLATEGDRLLLTPLEDGLQTPAELVEKLQYTGSDSPYSSTLLPLIPAGTELLGYELAEGILTLNFNTDPLAGLDENRQLAIIEGLLASFGSLDQVTAVQFQAAGAPLSSHTAYELSGPITPSRWINPEE